MVRKNFYVHTLQVHKSIKNSTTLPSFIFPTMYIKLIIILFSFTEYKYAFVHKDT